MPEHPSQQQDRGRLRTTLSALSAMQRPSVRRAPADPLATERRAGEVLAAFDWGDAERVAPAPENAAPVEPDTLFVDPDDAPPVQPKAETTERILSDFNWE
ncbi:MAG: hypothetical protein K2R98_06355 [Gemmataceae bacterium]|nr:hypothetical protein [Gemmataceae bacterium]